MYAYGSTTIRVFLIIHKMAQHYYVALALCLIIVAAESRALKSREISLPDGAVEMDIVVKQKTEGAALQWQVLSRRLN